MNTPPPATEVAAVLLAAGESRRMGRPKQLLPWGGVSLVRHAAQTALASCADGLFVVVGCYADAVRAELAGLPLTIVENPDYADGQASSLRCAIAAVTAYQAALVLLSDQPLVTAATLDGLIGRWRETGALAVVPRYQGQRGNPVLVDRCLFAELLALQGDSGARQLFERYASQIVWVEADRSVVVDVDNPEAYRELVGQVG